MGSYSWTDYCDLKVRPGKRELFEQYLVELSALQEPWLEYGLEHARVIKIRDDDTVDIQIDSWKIISYWYPETLDWFDKLSEFIEGDLELGFETNDERAIIHFGPEGTKYEIGRMKYDTFTSGELR